MKQISIVSKTINFTGDIKKWITSIILFYFCIINPTFAQSQIGMYCGNCSDERQSLDDAKKELGSAYDYLDASQKELDKANKAFVNASYYLTLAEEIAKNAKDELDIIQKLKENSEGAVAAAVTLYYEAKEVFKAAKGVWAIAKAAAAVARTQAAWLAAKAFLAPLIAKYATAAIVYFDATQAIPPLKDNYTIAENESNIALERITKAYKRLRDAKENELKRTEELKKCIDKIKTPGPCEKCENDNIVDKCTANEKCCDGVCIGKDDCCPACPSGQQCCNGICEPIEYEYNVTEIITDCNGNSNTNTYISETCSPENTQPSLNSFGICTNGVSRTCSQKQKECPK